VTLAAGHMSVEPPGGVEVVRFGAADEYLRVCRERFAECDVFIGAAAPADYCPEAVAPTKIAKAEAGDEIILKLRATPDVIADLASNKGSRLVVGFAAETGDIEERAAAKLKAKGMDLIVANDVAGPDAGFEVDTNSATLLWSDGRREVLPLMSKDALADALLDRIHDLLARRV
jgi:phosphopantothenoylcysteine decarboxylase/phosphopantothenate--cysteine ligase